VRTVESSSPPNLGFEFLPDLDLMVLVHMKNSPTDAEWEVYLDAITDPLASNRMRCVIIADGHPTRAQQAALIALSKGKLIPVAVVSASTSVRFAVSVFALVNRGIKSYSPKEYDRAFAHVGLAPAQFNGVRAVIDRLLQRLVSANRGSGRYRTSSSTPAPTTLP
jgi:hypothetical protein